MRILIVRLGSMGDIVHGLPAVAAIRAHLPDATIDWVVDWRHRELLEQVPILNNRVVLSSPGGFGSWLRTIRLLRGQSYDAAVDLQGLLKSGMLARASGAPRVVGFSPEHLREPGARAFYTEMYEPPAGVHVIQKNMRLAAALGAPTSTVAFPLRVPPSTIVDDVRRTAGWSADQPYGVINPGAAWVSKQWPPDRFGQVAFHIRQRHGLPSIAVWGPGEHALARGVADASDGAAVLAPTTSVSELMALASAARIFVAGDTGPLHLAAALGTPIVGIHGPTNPARNGPWAPEDVTVSRFEACGCHHLYRCRMARWCLADITADEVNAAVDRRLG